ncbi:MAG: hypothetical protein PHI18_01040 [bacterium]|nr:hypothetical protein [bacterium]
MHYIGKDVLTQGSLLHLDPRVAKERLRSRAKQGIRKAQRAGIRVEESRDLSQMARVWYNPDTLTSHLEPEQRMFLAYLKDQLIGGIIVTPVTSNTLFYHYGGTNEAGRAIEANAYLFWHVVETFRDSPYEYLDVGVSFRPELQHYFQKYCTQPYPILFRPPPEEVCPRLALEPFMPSDLDWPEQQLVAINTQLLEYFDAEFTYMPSGAFALQSALRALHLPDQALVGVWASVGESAYLKQLTDSYGDHFVFRAREKDAAAYLIGHRWGVPCCEAEALSAGAVPLVEDCRDLLYDVPGDQHSGSFGKYAVYDFTRWFPMPYGAALVGEYFPDRHVWDHFHCLDVTKRNVVREMLQTHWPRRMDYARARAANWARYAELFRLLGMEAACAAPEPPLAFLLRCAPPYTADAITNRLAEFRILCEMDERDGIAALPCHAGLTARHIEYIFGAFRGMVNPCHTFVRTDPAEAA